MKALKSILKFFFWTVPFWLFTVIFYKLPYGYRYIVLIVIGFCFSFSWLIIALPGEDIPAVRYDFIIAVQQITFGLVITFAFVSLVIFILKKLLPWWAWAAIAFFPALFVVGLFYDGLRGLIVGVVDYMQVNELAIDTALQNENFGEIVRLFWIGSLKPMLWTVSVHGIVPFLFTYAPVEFTPIAQKRRENDKWRMYFKEGKGGSAEWAGPATLEKFGWEPRNYRLDRIGGFGEKEDGLSSDRIFWGEALFEDDPGSLYLGTGDDVHMVTIGQTGSGKSRTAIWPNLATWAGSAIVFDPKGEHSRETWRRRCSKEWKDKYNSHGSTQVSMKHGRCYMLDPFGINKGTGIPAMRYNPLDDVFVEDPDLRKVLSQILNGLVSEEFAASNATHFYERARSFLMSLMVHVKTTEPQKNQNLPYMRDLFYGRDPETERIEIGAFDELLKEMLKNPVAGGIVQEGAAGILQVGQDERGSYMSTMARAIEWISEPEMRDHLSGSDFSLRQFGDKDGLDAAANYYQTVETLYMG